MPEYPTFKCNNSLFFFLTSHPIFVSFALFLTVPPSHIEESPEDDCREESDADKRKKLSIRDIVDLQETNFTVRVQPPGAESFELQVLCSL